MSEVVKLTEGWTAPLLFELSRDAGDGLGEIPFPRAEIEGTTIELILRGASGELVDTSSDVAWDDLDAAIVAYTPDAGDLLYADSPYTAHWRITDALGAIAFVPHGEPDTWVVYRP